jgi:hypothetical protein
MSIRRKDMYRWKYVFVLISFTMLVSAASVPASGGEYEKFSDRKVSDILPADKVAGEHYKIRETVQSSGYMDHFTLDSDYGVFEVTGDAALRKLLREIAAMEALNKIKSTTAFGKALAASAKKPIQFVGNLVTEPVDTVSSIPTGVGRLFSNAYSSITSKKQAGEDSSAEALLTLSTYKREYAYNLGVDPYSSNPVFQKELNRVAWAAAVGNLSFSAATAPIGGGIGLAISYTGFAQKINEYLKDNPPSQIRSDSEKHLSSIGISEEGIKKFLENKFFSPRHTAVIVASLMKLEDVKGRDVYLQYASTASDEEQANFMMQIAEMMRGFHEKVSPLKEISMNSDFVTASAANNSVLFPLPIDYGIWTESAEKILGNMVSASASSADGKSFELWVTGTISPLARKNLEALGIKVMERVDNKIQFVD